MSDRCLACGRPVAGQAVEINGVAPYCAECCRARPPCDVCGAPLTDSRWELSDGRITCAVCHSTAVYTPAAAQAAYAQVTGLVTGGLGLALRVPTGLALVDRRQLAGIIRAQQISEVQDADRLLGLYARRGIRRGIYAQTGLPRVLLMQVAAHEYGHAWQGENCPLLRDPLVREGFAEWVAYKVLAELRQARRLALMQTRTDIYGQGLRWALDLESRVGVPGVVGACRAAR